MKKALILAIATALTLGLASPAFAAIRITKIYFDSPGADTGTNKSLNAEYVQIKNTGTKRVYPTGWTLRDTGSHVYKFPAFHLGPGTSVKVHSGKGLNTAANLFWRLGEYVWNNDGDTARLRKKSGLLVDSCSYSGAGSYKIC